VCSSSFFPNQLPCYEVLLLEKNVAVHLFQTKVPCYEKLLCANLTSFQAERCVAVLFFQTSFLVMRYCSW
jgi:hypothetical protein